MYGEEVWDAEGGWQECREEAHWCGHSEARGHRAGLWGELITSATHSTPAKLRPNVNCFREAPTTTQSLLLLLAVGDQSKGVVGRRGEKIL